MARIGIFGAGYVGLVTGTCFADLGHDVIVRDVVPQRIDSLQGGGPLPIFEPGLDELVAANRERLRFTLDVREAVEGADFLFVCVGTPPTYSGDADLSAVWTVVDELPAETRGVTVVMKSTVPVGTGRKVRARLDERGLEQVGYVSNPEFLAEGTALRDFRKPDRIVVGAFEPADAEAVAGLHAGLDAPVLRTDVSSAEMIKLASNALLATKISFINEIANVCEATGADVEQVARGVGLDHRLGPHFLRAGIGFGGSCLVGEETVLVRTGGRTRLVSLERLYDDIDGGDELDVLAWRPDSPAPEFLPVEAVTRRPYEGDLVDVRTEMGRRVTATTDHPLVAADASLRDRTVKRADELTSSDWLPIAQGAPEPSGPLDPSFDVLTGLEAAGASRRDVIVRPAGPALAAVGAPELQRSLRPLAHARGAVARSHDILRGGALRLDELAAAGIDARGASLGTAKNGTHVPVAIPNDERFWRVVGLYVAEGHCTADRSRRRLQWTFHRDDEAALVQDVAGYWRELGVKADVRATTTATVVQLSSRVLAGWWLGVLGLGRNCYEQRIPDRLWDEPLAHKRAFLRGAWLGDGSWSLVAGGPSVVLEYGTVSRELADGLLRLLGELEVVARLKVGRTAKSTVDTYWLVVAGADQVERLLALVPDADVPRIEASLARQSKRIAPTGYRRDPSGTAWVRVTEARRRPFRGLVYSLEVPGAHTFVTTAGLVVHNCFPKDVSALKQLAGNSGYHFQLLSAVIEVNELQKRRVIGKLEKHLGKLAGRTIALLGLAFKPGTDDLREAPSIVLASRLLAEGAEVRAWDPVARLGDTLHGVSVHDSVLAAVTGADAAVIVTEWPELRELPCAEVRAAMARPLIVDGRNILDPDAVRAAGFDYESVGRPAANAALPA